MLKLIPKSLARQVADVLTDRIFTMALKPGDRIIEAKIAKELEVSQTSVREALLIMEQTGLVDNTSRRGTYVTTLTSEDIAALYDIMTHLYVMNVEKLSGKIRESFMDLNRKMLDEMEATALSEDWQGCYQAVFSIGSAMLSLAESRLLRNATEYFWNNKRRIEYLTIKHRRKELKTISNHFKTMFEAIQSKDRDWLKASIKQYMDYEKEVAIEVFRTEYGS